MSELVAATIEERLATLEAQMQGLAREIGEQIYGHELEWGLLDEADALE